MCRILKLGAALVLVLALTTPVLAQGANIHVVQPGENLYRIALRYGVSVSALAAANGIANPNHIYVGQRLTIPGSGGVPAGPSTPTSGTHVVQRGENLYRIALRYRVTMSALAAANGIVNPNRIYAGQVLRIPGRGAHPNPPAPVLSSDGNDRWIDVNLSTQTLTAYEGNTPVRSTLVSTGLPTTPTPTGRFRIYVKYLSDDMSGPGYYLPNVPYVMYFYRSYGLHGTYWHSNFGRPMSRGCVNLPTAEAEWLFNWAAVGTLVNIHY
jgi:LysM repeat protein